MSRQKNNPATNSYIGVCVDRETKAAIQKAARKGNRSMAAQCRHIFAQWVNWSVGNG